MSAAMLSAQRRIRAEGLPAEFARLEDEGPPGPVHGGPRAGQKKKYASEKEQRKASKRRARARKLDERKRSGDALEPERPRQSPSACAIEHGTIKELKKLGFRCVVQRRLDSGRVPDITALNESGEIWIVEIKSSPWDFRNDQKWQTYLPYCDRFFFAVTRYFPLDLIPQEVGLIVANASSAVIHRKPW